ncbi:MAG: hypothetical protein A2157_19020 [Deltaproteobacteria bacterium RBG_16_47_11]|nr:MAG: hypothetical protein A2157_19020 [Deltaproteobacteria bacterium RBG_16_47_11]
MAKRSADFGCNIVLVDIDSKHQKKIVNGIEKIGRQVFFPADVANYYSINEVVKKAIPCFGKIDILVQATQIS